MKLALLALWVLAACEVPPERPPELPVASVPVASVPAAPVAVAAPESRATGGSDAVRLAVTEASGIDPAAVLRVYGATRESLSHCHQPGGGTVHIRIVRQGASLHMHVEPGATLDPTAHRCVLEALSTVDLPDTGAAGGGPAVPPSGFTSLITLTW